MKVSTKTKLAIGLICLILVWTGCGSAGQQHTPNAGPVDGLSCGEPPSSFTWGQRTYTLKTIGNTDLEPGMKRGYLNCQDGVYTQQSEGENSTFNIYTYGSPLKSEDLLYFGKWGRALYSAEENSKAQIERNEPVLNIEVPSAELEPDVRDMKLDPRLEKDVMEKKQPLKGIFETSLDTVNSDGKLAIRFSLKNISGKDLRITHGSGQRYDVWIYNDQDEEVYRWSYNKAFTQALIERDFNKSEQLDFEEEWNLRDNKGDPVPAGTYTIAVEVMIGVASGTISREERVAKSTAEVNSSPVPYSVEVSFYKSGSPKGQPELINMYTDKSAPEKMKEFATWTQEGKASVDIDASQVERIYFIQLDFDNRTSEYYLFARANDKNMYLKQIQLEQVKNVNLDQFDSSLIRHLIDIAGPEGWMESTEIPQ